MENRMASAALGGAMVCGRQDAFKLFREFQHLEKFRRERQPSKTHTVPDPGLDVSDPFGEGAEEGVAEGIRINAIDMSSVSNSRNSQYMLMAEATRKLNDKGSNISLTRAIFRRAEMTTDNFSVSSTTYYQFWRVTWAATPCSTATSTSTADAQSQPCGRSVFHTALGKRLKMQLSYKFSPTANTASATPMTCPRSSGKTTATAPAGYLPRQLRDRLYGQPEQPKRKPQYLPYDGAYIELCRQGVGTSVPGCPFPPNGKASTRRRGCYRRTPSGNPANTAQTLTVAWRRKQTRVATDLRGETRQACVGRPAHTDRQQRPAGTLPVEIPI